MGGLEVTASVLPGAAEVAEGRVLDRRDLHGRESAGAPQPGELGGIAASGVDAVACFVRAQRGGHDPTGEVCLREITRTPVPAGASFVDKDERFRL